MSYDIAPGVYAVGNPSPDSPVLVTANFKLTVDRVRSQLTARDAWILVLDTKGINVWCAAGKGTFGTDELVHRIEASRLPELVAHRDLIVPQLGATGVSASRVRQLSGFRVHFGPVRAEDLPAYLDAGMKATAEMRRVQFPMRDRAALIPMDFIMFGRYALIAAAILVVLGGLGRGGGWFDNATSAGARAAAQLLGTFAAASILGPLLLPWLPGRAFSLKGSWIGLAYSLGTLGAGGNVAASATGGSLNAAAWLLLGPAIASFVVMNFTGASTYTSLSGVLREMRIAVPLQITAAVVGVVLWLASRFV